MVTLWQPLKNKNLLRTSSAWILNNYHKIEEPVQPDLENSRFLYAGFYCMCNWNDHGTPYIRNNLIMTLLFIADGNWGCLPFTKSFREIQLESNRNTTFRVVSVKNFWKHGTSEKVGLFSQSEYSKRKYVFYFFKAIFDTSFSLSRPFFILIKTD